MALLQPSIRFTDGLRRAAFHHAGDAVSIHPHLAHVARHAGLFQFIHQNQGGVGMEGREHAHPGGAVGHQLLRQAMIHIPGVVRILKAAFIGIGVGSQPVQQGQIHAHTQHGILGRMQVQVGKGLKNQVVPVVFHRGGCILVRQYRVNPHNDPVLCHQIAMGNGFDFAHFRGGKNVAFQNREH